MANNLENRDAYIIIGVSDSNSVEGIKIKGVPAENRKNQQKLIDFLRCKKFAGDERPMVYVSTITIPDDNGITKQIDVIVISNSAKTPYFLTEDYQEANKKVRAGHIYTRVGDTNTPIDAIADITHIKYLWRKRFGIDLSIRDRLLRLLDKPNDWEGILDTRTHKYHKIYPEFQLYLVDIEDQSMFLHNKIMENIAYCHCDRQYSVSKVIIKYHVTTLFSAYVLWLDGARRVIPLPHTHTIENAPYESEGSLTYAYLKKDTIEGKLFNCFAVAENNWYGEKWRLKPGVGFLIFEDEADKEQFDKFAKEKLPTLEQEYYAILSQKHYVGKEENKEYFSQGWSKGNEIKAQHLYEQFKGIENRPLIEKIPDL